MDILINTLTIGGFFVLVILLITSALMFFEDGVASYKFKHILLWIVSLIVCFGLYFIMST
jgi:hypothetical protein